MIERRTFLGLMALGLVSACAAGPDRPAGRPPLMLLHRRSAERVLLPAAREPWSTAEERETSAQLAVLFRDRRTGERHPVDPALPDVLRAIHAHLGVADGTPIELVSGYRSPSSNARLIRRGRSVAVNSFHLQGRAADIRIAGVPPRAIAAAARSIGRGGYAWYPDSGFAHIDTGPVRTWGARV